MEVVLLLESAKFTKDGNRCLNPCFNGSGSFTFNPLHLSTILMRVLILVLMEVVLLPTNLFPPIFQHLKKYTVKKYL